MCNSVVERFEEGVLRVKAGAGVAEGSVTPLAGGYNHSLLLRNDGGVAVWGVTNSGEGVLATGLTNVAGVAAGSSARFSLVWRKDGTATGWGSNNPAVINAGVLAGLSNVVGMAGGTNHALALRRDGTVTAWGTNAQGQTSVPAELASTNATNFVRAVAVTAAEGHSLALRADGTVRMWGANSYFSAGSFAAISNAVGLAAGADFVLSLHADGSVRYTGRSGSDVRLVPGALTNAGSVASNPAVAIAAGANHGLAIRRDGSVLAWGESSGGQTTLPAGLTNAAAVAGGNQHSLILLRDGTVQVAAAINNTNRVTLPGGVLGAVPQGGPDSDGDGWSNEAELRSGSHPLNVDSYPAKVTLANGTTQGTVTENGSLVVGTLKARDRMGWEESLENLGGVRVLGPDGDRFEVVGQQLKLKTAIDFESLASAQLEVTLEVQGIPQALGVSVVNDPSDDGDTVAPVITLLGGNPLRVSRGGTFVDPGARVTDNVDAERTVTTADMVDTAQPGTYVLAYTAADQAGNAATPVTRRVVVGRTPEFWLPPGQEMTPALLRQYALGGANSPEERPQPQIVSVQTNGGVPQLALTVLVRIDDPSLQVEAEASTNLGAWSTDGISSAPSSDQTNVPEGFERRVFTMPADATRRFIRLKITQ